MNRKVFALIYAVITLAVLAAAVGTAVTEHRKWPATKEEYEDMVEDALGAWDGTKEIAGASHLLLQPDLTYTDGEVVVRTEDNYLLTFYPEVKFNMNRAINKIRTLKEYCDGLEIPLLCVRFPSKATYSEHSSTEYGIRSVDRETRELFLKRVRKRGIPTLDMNRTLKDKGLSEEDVFYRTDHHWKTEMGLIAAREIAGFLQAETSEEVHPELLGDEFFRKTDYPYQWLGETGRKVSSVWTGKLDSYTLFEPNYETSLEYCFPASDIVTEGNFSVLLDRELFNREPILYQDSLHYAYMKDAAPVTIIRNKAGSGASILMIKDSYAVPVAPFLALTTGELTCWDMRRNRARILDYIGENRFDAVIIAYTDVWRDEMYNFR